MNTLHIEVKPALEFQAFDDAPERDRPVKCGRHFLLFHLTLVIARISIGAWLVGT